MSAGNTDEVKVKIVTEADSKGTVDAAKKVGDVKKKAEEAGNGLSTMFGRTKAGLQSISQQFEFLNKIVGGLGALALIQRVYGWYATWRDEIAKNKKAVEDLNESVAAINQEERLQATTDEYERLAKAIDKANKQREVENALIDMELKVGRELEDAQSRLAEAKDLAAISPDDPLAAEKKNEVKAKYASYRAQTNMQRKIDDNTSEIDRLQQQRDALTEAAGLDNLKAEDLAKQAATMRRDAFRTENQNKATSVTGIDLGKNKWSGIYTGDVTQQKADAEAAAAMRQKAVELQKKADEAREASEEKSRKRAELLEQIAIKIDRRVGLDTERQAMDVENSYNRREAAGSTEQKRQAVIAEREEKKRAEQSAALERSKKALEERQASEQARAQQRASEAGYSYSTAKGRYDERTGALRFRKEQGDYRGNVDADPTIKALNNSVVEAQGKLVTATRDLANLATSHKAQLDAIQRQIDKLNANQHNSKMGSGE